MYNGLKLFKCLAILQIKQSIACLPLIHIAVEIYHFLICFLLCYLLICQSFLLNDLLIIICYSLYIKYLCWIIENFNEYSSNVSTLSKLAQTKHSIECFMYYMIVFNLFASLNFFSSLLIHIAALEFKNG